MGARLRIVPIDPLEDPRWDVFVRSRPDATPYHLGAWARILPAAYRFRPRCLAAEEDGRLRGVLPLMCKRGPLSGTRIRSLPVVQVAGPLVDDRRVAAPLLDAACSLAHERDALLVVDSRMTDLDTLVDGLAQRPQSPTWIAPVPRPEDLEAWQDARSRNLRRGIARASAHRVTARATTQATDLRMFHRLYLRTMRRHRSLPRTLKHFELARRVLHAQGAFVLMVAQVDSTPVAGVLCHLVGDTLELVYNGSDDRYFDSRPNHGLYAFAFRWASERGLRHVDFGGAWANSSLAGFKRQWGAVEVPEYRYVSAGAPATVDVGSSMTAGKRGSVRSRLEPLWDRAPLRVTATAGGLAYRWL